MSDEAHATPPITGNSKLSLDILESHLWAAADKLRGSIDSADYKNYIFGLLFLKRVNDRFEEETEEVAEEYGIPLDTARDDRDLHEEFWVPERARWNHIKAQETDVGATLNKALAAVEDENDAIADRVLTTVDFNDKDRLPDALLSDLVSHFSKHRYRNADLEDPDIFGRAYEYLIREFADDAGKKGGEFYTPREVVRLIVKCVNPEPGHRVYDPCCGSGGMLIYSAEHIREQGGNMDDISLYGQEKNLNTWAIGQMNVLLHELYDAKIEKGDTITEAKRVTKHDELEQFNRVIANPMWNQKEWNKEWVEENEPYNRFPYGLPPSNNGDWAWVQVILSSLNQTGKAAVVLDNGSIFRSRTEGDIRRKVIEENLLEAVITLPEKLFYNTDSAGCILILNKDKPAHLHDKVQIIYAGDKDLRNSPVQLYEELSNQNRLTEQGIEYISETYQNQREENGHSRIVDIQELKQNDWNLTPSRYIQVKEVEEKPPVSQKYSEIEEILVRRNEAERELSDVVDELIHSGLGHDEFKQVRLGAQTKAIPKSWDKAQIGDLAHYQNGYGFSSSEWSDEGMPIVRIQNLTESAGEETNYYQGELDEKYIITAGDILVSWSGTLGVFRWDGPKAGLNQHIFKVNPDYDVVDKDFLYYLLEDSLSRLERMLHGSTMKHITKSAFESTAVVLPPLDEQRKIADILKTVDNTLEVEKEYLSSLEDIQRGMLSSLLTGGRDI